MAQLVKKLAAMREIWVLSLGCEDPLEKGMATYSSILAWKIPWPYIVHGVERVRGFAKSQTQLNDFHSKPSTISLHHLMYGHVASLG